MCNNHGSIIINAMLVLLHGILLASDIIAISSHHYSAISLYNVSLMAVYAYRADTCEYRWGCWIYNFMEETIRLSDYINKSSQSAAAV